MGRFNQGGQIIFLLSYLGDRILCYTEKGRRKRLNRFFISSFFSTSNCCSIVSVEGMGFSVGFSIESIGASDFLGSFSGLFKVQAKYKETIARHKIRPIASSRTVRFEVDEADFRGCLDTFLFLPLIFLCFFIINHIHKNFVNLIEKIIQRPPSVSVTSWSTAISLKTSIPPPIQRTSIRSTRFRSPNPK